MVGRVVVVVVVVACVGFFGILFCGFLSTGVSGDLHTDKLKSQKLVKT